MTMEETETRWCLSLTCLKILSVFLTLLFMAGCATSHNPTPDTSNTAKQMKKVAVLPFYNITGQKDAGKIVSNIFVSEMFKSGRFHVEEPGNIAQFMIQERMETIGEIEMERLKILGKRLGVDEVLTGTVEEFDDGRSSGVPMISITARIIDSNSGRLVWSQQNKKRGDDYIIVLDLGEVRSVATLAQKVIKEMIETIK